VRAVPMATRCFCCWAMLSATCIPQAVPTWSDSDRPRRSLPARGIRRVSESSS
jgi:hypothetical protein